MDVFLPDKRDDALQIGGKSDDRSRERAASRIRAFDFLLYLRFPEVLLQAPELTEWVPPRVMDGDSPYVEMKTGHNQSAETYSTVVPLSWIDHNKPATLEQLTKFFSAAVSKTERGLTSEDARALASVIIFELVENVFTHAGGSRLALVSAWSRRTGQNIHAEDYLDEEREFLSDVQTTSSSIVEIIVGDAGEGVVKTLESDFRSNFVSQKNTNRKINFTFHEVINWAFNRWSSCKKNIDIEKRGVRGLYRVARIVSRYRGLISVQSHLLFQTRNYRGYGKPAITNQAHPYAYTRGTLLRLRLPVSHLAISRTILKPVQPWSEAVSFIHKDSELISMGSIEENGIDDNHKKIFFERIKTREENHGVIYITFHGDKYYKHGIEAALTFLAKNSAPYAVAVFGLPAHGEQLNAAIDSVNETISCLRGRDHNGYEQVDPLLVFSYTGAAIWVGVTSLQKAAYETIMQTPGISLHELIDQLNKNDSYTETELSELLRLLHEHNAIARANVAQAIGEKTQSIEQLVIAMNFEELLSLVANEISAPLLNDGISLSGVTRRAFLTPSLKKVNKWIELPRFLETNHLAINGYTSMASLALKIRCSREFGDGVHALLSDTSATSRLCKYFGSFLGLDQEHIIDAEAQPLDGIASPIQGKEKRAIVYADLIASSETAKRTIVYALRQGYEVVAIACVLDTRIRLGEPLMVWGIPIPVIAIANHTTEKADDAKYDLIKSPIGEDESLQEEIPTRPSDIHHLITSSKIVSLGHSIRPNGRHLTFTIKPQVFLEDAMVLKKLCEATAGWLSDVDSDISRPVEVWTPVEREKADIWGALVGDAFRPAAGNRKFSVARFQKLDSYETTHFKRLEQGTSEGKHVIVFDWGAITGASITQLMRRAVEGGAFSVLGIVILSQMEAEDEAFLSKVTQMKAVVPGEQPDLLTPGLPKENMAVVKIKWLETFTMGHYSAVHCPICSRLREFEEEHPRTDYLQQFCSAEIKKLKPRRMRDLPEPSAVDIFGDATYLDAVQVSSLRQQLHSSYFSTISRLWISKEIFRIGKEIALATRTDAALISACTLVMFLASEPNWLKRAPLHFRPIRQSLADICKTIAITQDVPDDIRSTSIQVLRMVSKERYSREFKKILGACVEKNVSLLQPLLYGAHTILKRGYHEHEGLLTPLNTELNNSLLILDQETNQEELWPAKSTLESLIHECDFFLRRINKRLISEQAAYANLQNLLGDGFTQHSPPVKHFDLLKTDNVRRKLEVLVQHGSNESLTQAEFDEVVAPWLRDCKEYWSYCLTFMELDLMPNLRLIQKTIDPNSKQDSRQRDSTWKLIKLISRYDESGYPENEITTSVEVLNGCRSTTDFTNPVVCDAWRKFNDWLDWYGEMFFRPKGISGIAGRISAVPTTLRKGFEKGKHEAFMVTGEDQGMWVTLHQPDLSEMEIEVYCPGYLLEDLFCEIFRNMHSHILPDALSVGYVVKVFYMTEDIVSVEITNNNTAKFDKNIAELSHVLARLKELFVMFGGALSFGEPLAFSELDDATFCIKVDLHKWKGH